MNVCDAMTPVAVCYLLMSLVFPLCELPLGENIKISVTVHTSKHTHTHTNVHAQHRCFSHSKWAIQRETDHWSIRSFMNGKLATPSALCALYYVKYIKWILALVCSIANSYTPHTQRHKQ